MQINNNSQSPNFGMALRVHPEGVQKYVAGNIEKAKGLMKLGELAGEADKVHARKIAAMLEESNVEDKFLRENLTEEFTPNIYVDKYGQLDMDTFINHDCSDKMFTVSGDPRPDLSKEDKIQTIMFNLTEGSQQNALEKLKLRLNEMTERHNLDKLLDDIVSKFS